MMPVAGKLPLERRQALWFKQLVIENRQGRPGRWGIVLRKNKYICSHLDAPSLLKNLDGCDRF